MNNKIEQLEKIKAKAPAIRVDDSEGRMTRADLKKIIYKMITNNGSLTADNLSFAQQRIAEELREWYYATPEVEVEVEDEPETRSQK